MRRFALLTATTLFVAAASSQGVLSCLDPDVLRGLLLQGSNYTTFTAAVPAELATFKPPATFAWIGASERCPPSLAARRIGVSVGVPECTTFTTAAYRTSLSADAGRDAATSALKAAGWKLNPLVLLSRNVAFSAADAVSADRYCLDGKAASVGANVLEGVTYVTVSISGNCSPPPQPPSGSFFSIESMMYPLAQYLPLLDAPLDPASRQAVAMRTASGGGLGAQTHVSVVRFTLKDSPANVATHFARQMAQQGWTADANWSGATTAGSTWSKDVAADTPLRATLSVTRLDDNQFSASLRVGKAQ